MRLVRLYLSLVALLQPPSLSSVLAFAPPDPELLETSQAYFANRHGNYNHNESDVDSLWLDPPPEGVWESANQYRRRMRQRRQRQRSLQNKIESGALNLADEYYKTDLTADDDDEDNEDEKYGDVNNEMCRFLTTTECQEMEDAIVAKAKKTRSVSQQTHQIRTLVIPVVWKDHLNIRTLPSREELNTLWNGATGSVADYVKTMSYGSVTLRADILGWRQADNTEGYYADGRSGIPRSGDYTPALRDAFHYILDQLEAENFAFEGFNADNDEYIDHVQFLHSGYGAEIGGEDCQSKAYSADRIWSHMMPEGRSEWQSKKSKLRLGAFSVASAFKGRCGSDRADLGVMMHEFFHSECNSSIGPSNAQLIPEI